MQNLVGDMYQKKLKRIIDIFGAGLALIVLSPLFIFITMLTFIFLGVPIVFKQPRAGFKGKMFFIYKFRTMQNLYDKEGKLLLDDERLTCVGKFLRAASLDELPELWNVLKGDMSLVGPRPLLLEYLPLYSKEQSRRHEVRPGITGLAQINGRNTLDWKKRFATDVWYVDHLSFWLDMKVLFFTFLKVLKSEGISQKNHATMEKFRGNIE